MVKGEEGGHYSHTVKRAATGQSMRTQLTREKTAEKRGVR